MAVAEALRGQDLADDDHRRPPHPGGEHLGGDVAEGAAQRDLVVLARVGDDRRRAVAPVMRQQVGHDLLDPLDGQVQHQRGANGAEAGQVLPWRHRGGPLRDPGEHHRLADAGDGQLAAQGGRRGGERRDARRDVVGDAEPVKAARLLGDGAEDGGITRAEPDHVAPRRVRPGHHRDDLLQGEVGGVGQRGVRRAVREHLGGHEAARVQAY